MKSSLLLLESCLAGAALAVSIATDYQSLLWKYNGVNFYAPIGLDATVYELESTAGAAPEALSKRCSDGGCSGTLFLPCTVVTIDDELSASSLETQLRRYTALDDDVWSEEQVRRLIHDAHEQTLTSSSLENAFLSKLRNPRLPWI